MKIYTAPQESLLALSIIIVILRTDSAPGRLSD